MPSCELRWLKLLHNQDGNEPKHLSSWTVFVETAPVSNEGVGKRIIEAFADS
jgi:hypothetical protein